MENYVAPHEEGAADAGRIVVLLAGAAQPSGERGGGARGMPRDSGCLA